MTPDPGRRGERRRGRRKSDAGPRRLADALDDALAAITDDGSRGRPRGAAAARTSPPAASASTWGTVFSRWEEIVGPAVARHARPLRLENGALVVAVDRPPWATEVRTLGAEILSRLSERTGEPLERLVVVVRT